MERIWPLGDLTVQSYLLYLEHLVGAELLNPYLLPSPPPLSGTMGQRLLPTMAFAVLILPSLSVFHGESHGNFTFWKSVVGLPGLRIFLYFFQHLLWLSWLLMVQRTYSGST